VIQYDNVFAYAGNQIVAKGADVLATDMTAADNSTVEIENDSGASAWAARMTAGLLRGLLVTS